MKKILLGLLFFFFLTSAHKSYAASEQYITIVNPVRGQDFFQLKTSPLDNVKKQWQEIEKRNLKATWLVRPDALSSDETVNFFKALPKSQELGLFMEVTPTWTNQSGVSYHKSGSWHFAASVFLTGYEVSEREKLIDTAFEKFKKDFGAYPKSVGAWWIDAGSLQYMRDKYQIEANMDVADQYSTDNYSVWGQYFSTPFYPSKMNALIPASSDNKIGVVTIQWATRDPFNSYGNGVLDSTYSVQANDYANKKYHNLNIDYFRSLLSVYLDNPYSKFGQVTVGLENDFDWNEFGNEYVRQLDEVNERRTKGAKVLTASEFANSYKNLFPNDTPSQVVFAKDPLGSDGYVLWFQNLRYRVGWFVGSQGSIIKDLRLYYESREEPCLNKRCDILNLATIESRNIDEVTYGASWILDEGKISDVSVKSLGDKIEISYLNQSGHKRIINFLNNDISVDSLSLPVSVQIAQALDNAKNIKKIESHFNFSLNNGLISVLVYQFKGLLIFLLFIVSFFYLPGIVLLKKNLSPNTRFILSFPVGISAFTLAAFIFGFLRFPWGIYILPVASLLAIRKSFCLPEFRKINIAAAILVIIGSITWLCTSVKNGLLYDYGMGFWGPHGHDGIWHLGLIESIKRSLPPENPAFAGELLRNYHYFYDLLLAQTSNISYISSNDLYFRFFPILISLLIGAVTFQLANMWFKSRLVALLSVFFIYFGSSFGWILSIIRNKSFGGESLFWAQQSISTLLNPPFAISILLFLAGLYLFYKIIEEKNQGISFMLSLIIMWGVLIEFKAYAGILVLGSLLIVSLFKVIKKDFGVLKIFIPTLLISLLVFLPNNLGGGSLLVFSPFWLIHSMVDSPDRLGWFRLSLTRMSGLENGNWFKFIGAEALGFVIFFFGNLGTRVVGLLSINSQKTLVEYSIFIFSFLTLSLILPLLFIQKGANFNTIQFFYYFLILADFLAAAGLAFVIKKAKIIGVVVSVLVIFATLPTTWDNLGQYLPSRPPSRISLGELEALNFLRKQDAGTVLNYYYNPKLKEKFSEPVPIFAYESTMYLAAFSGKKEFIADTVNLIILGADYKGRLQAQKDVFSFKEPEIVKKIFSDNKISYVYLPKVMKLSFNETLFGLKRIFDNSEVEIFKVI